ncbi:hypothetical protein NQ317_014720 [Molorchus minor]|uniref:Uncharacterized protein n=1 Tax=Molorchus minor TaxID=1323400 RepID=A0ABQ9JKQ5_9CUCU|nr:hypothetical protein NQ317_014720 [Molorchus minor]
MTGAIKLHQIDNGSMPSSILNNDTLLMIQIVARIGLLRKFKNLNANILVAVNILRIMRQMCGQHSGGWSFNLYYIVLPPDKVKISSFTVFKFLLPSAKVSIAVSSRFGDFNPPVNSSIKFNGDDATLFMKAKPISDFCTTIKHPDKNLYGKLIFFLSPLIKCGIVVTNFGIMVTSALMFCKN